LGTYSIISTTICAFAFSIPVLSIFLIVCTRLNV
jgi:hypothetical protein